MSVNQRFGQTRTLLIIYGVAYLYSIHFAPFWAKYAPNSPLNQVHERCFQKAHPMLKNMLSARGSQYIIGDNKQSKTLDDCLLTFWGSSHAFLYFILGYFCPQTFWITFWIGVGFEVYENIQYDCADPLDIIWNTAGFKAGQYLSTY